MHCLKNNTIHRDKIIFEKKTRARILLKKGNGAIVYAF